MQESEGRESEEEGLRLLHPARLSRNRGGRAAALLLL
jgi:hypothetical protein